MGKEKDPHGTAERLTRLIIFGIFTLGLVLLLGGIVVAIIGNQADTAFIFLGQKFSSTSVGVALAFIGAVMVVFLIRRVLGFMTALLKA